MSSILLCNNTDYSHCKKYAQYTIFFFLFVFFSSFELDIVCSVSVMQLQHRSGSVCMSIVKLGYHYGETAWPQGGK